VLTQEFAGRDEAPEDIQRPSAYADVAPGVAPGIRALWDASAVNHDILYLTSPPTLMETTEPFVDPRARRILERKFVCGRYIAPSSDRCPTTARFTSATRQLLVDWAFSRRNAMNLSSETAHLAIAMADTFLRNRNPEVFLERHAPPEKCRRLRDHTGPGPALPAGWVPEDAGSPRHEPAFPAKLQRLMCTSLLVAAKMHERQSMRPPVESFACADDQFHKREILAAERVLIKELRYMLLLPTAVSFSSAYMDRAWALSGRFLPWRHLRMEQRVATYLLDVCALSHDLLDWPTSLLAAGAVWVATGMLRQDAGEGGPLNWSPYLGLSTDPGKVFQFEPSLLLDAVCPGLDAHALLGHPPVAVRRVATALSELCRDAQAFPTLAVHFNTHPLNEGRSILVNTLARLPAHGYGAGDQAKRVGGTPTTCLLDA